MLPEKLSFLIIDISFRDISLLMFLGESSLLLFPGKSSFRFTTSKCKHNFQNKKFLSDEIVCLPKKGFHYMYINKKKS